MRCPECDYEVVSFGRVWRWLTRPFRKKPDPAFKAYYGPNFLNLLRSNIPILFNPDASFWKKVLLPERSGNTIKFVTYKENGELAEKEKAQDF